MGFFVQIVTNQKFITEHPVDIHITIYSKYMENNKQIEQYKLAVSSKINEMLFSWTAA